ncbi:auxin-responsive protein IAA20-like isoform X1 [Phragmites australis]|uniref:auxin-responsive protein IAA20-like isoform X1 n=1 Tax=Phragmites australis TaxID=29695 RepID=UPI002D78ED7C|nr:auxin-responsive protein IAA20-like isoform X1 [Phragmites australis]
MELELGLALPNARPPAGEFVGLINSAAGACGKRGFGEAFGAGKATLPLFVRDGEGSDGEGGGDGVVDCEMGSKRKKLVGWPPVKCAHKRSCGGGGGYVKVKMEGVAIGRKVGVSLHGSYDELLRTLDRMFPSANQGAHRPRPATVAVLPPPPLAQTTMHYSLGVADIAHWKLELNACNCSQLSTVSVLHFRTKFLSFLFTNLLKKQLEMRKKNRKENKKKRNKKI